ncbi:MAG: ribosome small subunit-dependent GTPase A [Xanthomonadales bacterium]|nr:ribosome small subunit-dependent GTPase A [Xanthomonadales bacterium]
MVANVDRALILSALDGDFNPRRLERYLGLALASGVAPLVVLTKADRVAPEERERCEAIARALLPGLEVRVADPRSPAAGALLAPCLAPGETVVLLGSSGVGKSTLVNTLAGAPLRRTGEVRQRDGKGRHTTTERTLIPLPGGACVIDTPGLRTIAFAASESELPLFAEIEALAVDCRFRDCRHESEPGCAVRAAAEEGRLDRERLAHFRKLRAELAAARRARER